MVNLKNTKGIILKIKSRNRSGSPFHKSEFAVEDKKAVIREIKLWVDKLGIPRSTFKKALDDNLDKEEMANVKDLIRKQIKESEENTQKALKF